MLAKQKRTFFIFAFYFYTIFIERTGDSIGMDNALSSIAPYLLVEWSEKNYPLTPDDVSYGSNRKVWWKGVCGHEGQAAIKSRATGKQSGCPYCSGNRVLAGFNDLETRFPNVAAEWSERNAPLLPSQVLAFTNRKVWWKGKCGHEWNALVSDRSSGHGCPYCRDHKLLIGFNDFQTCQSRELPAQSANQSFNQFWRNH